MTATLVSAQSRNSAANLTVTIPTSEFRSLPMGGVPGAHMGSCYISAVDVPRDLENWMQVNPRVPNRTGKNRLSGPVPKAILSTLRDEPSDFALKNVGMYLLVDEAEFKRATGGGGELKLTFTDPSRHGLVNGGHTFASICQALDEADDLELDGIRDAYVRLHVMRGIPEDKVVEIAEGLNRSKQVQNPSLQNLQGNFESIKDVMDGRAGADQIAYHEGADGDVYIGEILAFIEMFNLDRYPTGDGQILPSDLYGRQYKAVGEFAKDVQNNRAAIDMVISQVPEILRIADEIRKRAPIEAKKDEIDFEIGRMTLLEARASKAGRKPRVASAKHKDTPLHFINETTNYRLPSAWLYPMLAAFRENVRWDSSKALFDWRVPNDELLEACMTDLVMVCVQEHKANQNKPEWVGKKDSAYRQCGLYVELYLARHESSR